MNKKTISYTILVLVLIIKNGELNKKNEILDSKLEDLKEGKTNE